MTSPIQIPYLRPDPIHEGAGLEQAGGEDQMGQLAKLLMLKGHLALEQEKFQSEEQERKQKKQALTQAGGTLSQLLSQPGVMDDPSKLAGAFGQAAGPLTAAGAGPEATGLLREVPGLQKQAQLTHTQRALGDVVKQFQAGDITDQKNQARTVAAMSAIDPDAGRSFAESLRALGGRYTLYTDVLGQHWIGDTQRGTEHKGELGAPRSGAGRGGANVPITTEEARTTAQIGAQALANILHIVQTDPEALHVPAVYAGISNAKTAGGIAGALAGMVEPLAQTQLSPHQQMIMRFRDQFLESYMALITGKRGAGSPALLSLARNSFFPMANQDDPQVHASAVKS